MSAVKYNLQIEQGATFAVRFIWQDNDKVPIDLTNYTAKIQFRENKEDDAVLYDSTTDDDITLGGEDGTIDFSISATVTEAFDFDNAYWDLELTEAPDIKRLIEGRVYLSKEVTR